MTADKLNKTLVKLLPKISDAYIEETEWQEGDFTGSHIVFGDVFFPYIVECLNADDDTNTKKCFEVIEKILKLDDDYANEVITLSVLENLFYEQLDNDVMTLYMHEKTKSIFEQIENQNK